MVRIALMTALLLSLAAPARSAADTSIGLVTILEGDVVVLRDTREFPAVEGLRLRGEDIVRTGNDTRLARLELGDGSVLDLGPQTELQLQPRPLAAAGERPASLYLLRGWLKVGASGNAVFALASPRMDVARVAGQLVVRALPQASLVCVEAGRAELVERHDGKPGATHALKDGDAFVSRATPAGALQRRPPPDLLDGMPRAFADPLPRRARLWQARAVEPAVGAEVDYADAAPWINAEAALRPGFVQRYASLARDKRFRTSLVAEHTAHPEWDRTLHPEKYRPKPPVVTKRLAPPTGPELAPPTALEADGSGLAKAPLASWRGEHHDDTTPEAP